MNLLPPLTIPTELTRAQVDEAVLEAVKAPLAEKDQATVKLETNLVDDLGMDSLDVTELEMELERRLDGLLHDQEKVRIPSDALQRSLAGKPVTIANYQQAVWDAISPVIKDQES